MSENPAGAPDDERTALYLLDGYSLIYRTYFAFMRNPLRNPDGRNISAVFGFFRTLLSILQTRRPSHFAVALDSKTPTFRHEKYPEYKATREKAPDDLREQIPVIEEVLTALKVPMLRIDGMEADDIMATLATRCRADGTPCFIISGDKDLLQLVDEPVRILRPDRDGFRELTRTEVFDDWSVYPEQILDYLSLVGDSSDNVPGVKGIGDKTAVALLEQFTTLDAVYENLETITGSRRKKLEEGRENAYLSRDLITLETDVELPLEFDELTLDAIDGPAAAEILMREGMKSVASEYNRYRPSAPAGPEEEASPVPEGGAETPSTAELPDHLETIDDRAADLVMLTSISELRDWVARAKQAGTFAFDSETDDINPVSAEPVGFSLAFEADSACYIPIRGPDGPVLEADEVKQCLRELLANPELTIVGQNFKYDYKVLARWGVRPTGRVFDTMIAAWLIDSTANTYNMDRLAEQYLSYRTIRFSDVVPRKDATFDEVPLDVATRYAAEDADVTFRLYGELSKKLAERGLDRVFRELEMPLVPILAEMELAGIALSPGVLEQYGLELEALLDGLQAEVYRLCGREFNLASTKQLQEVLFEDRKLTPVKKTKTGYSTDTAVLQQLAHEDPVPEKVLRHRLLSKLKSTYVDSLPKLVNPRTGRIHTNFNVTGTATGRLSSIEPNLQNIPIRDEEGRRIRSAFVSDHGWSFVTADYAQIELVVLAHLSGDPALRDAFANNIDVHKTTASLIFGLEIDDVTAEQRRIAKTINFGVMYGMSAFRLSNELGISRADAAGFIDAYFTKYAKIREFIDNTVRGAEKNGYVKTILGHERRIHEINNRNKTVKMAAERTAVNTPIQGSAADIVKVAMLRIAARLSDEKRKSRLILQVHDELILEAPDDEAHETALLVEHEMTHAVELDVPLRVSIEIGKDWGAFHS
ncbi:MAG: DNA polymerase I [Spirochaetaceae bacterium]|nr:MAG: DNA polymerase I [Spirochaetaceae bacterium]